MQCERDTHTKKKTDSKISSVITHKIVRYIYKFPKGIINKNNQRGLETRLDTGHDKSVSAYANP